MEFALLLAFALALDAAFGEPDWLWQRLPHPAVLMGRAIGWADNRFNIEPERRAKGILVVACFCLVATVLGWILTQLGPVVEVLVAAILLAQRSLVDHVRAVAEGLRVGLPEGRAAVALIVGRDTAELAPAGVARAAIESASENFSDGVVAPAFWFLIAGLPGILVYKLVNTADSMIGYRTPRHEAFGWAAARLDDVLNWIPARLSAVFIALAQGQLSQMRAIASDARLHRSPNAGWPEAAMARGLDVALSGPRSYAGRMQEFPFVHPDGQHQIGPHQIEAACAALWRTWALFLGVVLLLALL
ncbi:MAG: adenosylcobinamide-phosphate synthase CbiB [Dinoroseobacter sp.]|nr:adenosylcobinamide-phosphate synthase CbiB [Dinoroseobacter sp.]